MNIKKLLLKLLFAGVLVSGVVQASPVTFEFILPAWSQTSNPVAFGANGVLDVMIDSGASNLSNQTYLNSKILSVSIKTVGGTYDHVWTGSFTDQNGGLLRNYISTNLAGIPTLDLLATLSSTSSFNAYDGTTFLQFGQINPTGGAATFYLWDKKVGNSMIEPFIISPLTGHPILTGFSVTGHVVNSNEIPEPRSLAIFGLAFVCLVAFGGRQVTRQTLI
jgi:hypothetical protein